MTSSGASSSHGGAVSASHQGPAARATHFRPAGSAALLPIAFVFSAVTSWLSRWRHLNHADRRGPAPAPRLHSRRPACGGRAERTVAMPRIQRSRRARADDCMARMMRKSNGARSPSDAPLLLFCRASHCWFATFPITRTESTARLHPCRAASTPGATPSDTFHSCWLLPYPIALGGSPELCESGAGQPGEGEEPSMWASDVGTHRGHIGSRTPEARQRNTPVYRYFSNAGGGTRTPDTRIMIPLL